MGNSKVLECQFLENLDRASRSIESKNKFYYEVLKALFSSSILRFFEDIIIALQ